MTTWQTTWAINKYWLMARSQHLYNQGRALAKNNAWNADKQRAFSQLLATANTLTPTKQTLTTAYQHVWGISRNAVPQQNGPPISNYSQP